MAKRLLIDTDVLIEYLRGRRKAVKFLENQSASLAVSVITVAELFAGVKGQEEQGALEQFLAAFDVLAVTQDVAVQGGFYRRDFGPSHNTSLPDALIAATAEFHGIPLATFNVRHFPMLDEVRKPYQKR